MVLWPATKTFTNANLGQPKAALKTSGLAKPSTALQPVLFENIYFSSLQHSATSPASPAATAICPLFSNSPTLRSFWAAVKIRCANCPVPDCAWGEKSSPARSAVLSEGPGASLSCDLTVQLCPQGSYSIGGASALLQQWEKEGLRPPNKASVPRRPTRQAVMCCEAAGAAVPFPSPHMVPGTQVSPHGAPVSWKAQGMQKWAKLWKVYEEESAMPTLDAQPGAQTQHKGT